MKSTASSTAEQRLLAGAWLAVVAACFLPLESLEIVSLCAFRAVTAIPCPGCGIGHSIYEFFGGDWLASLAYHPLGPVVAVAWTAWTLRTSLRLPSTR